MPSRIFASSVKIHAAVSFVAVLLFSFLGPLGSFSDLSFLTRLLFWAIAVFGCGAIFEITLFLLQRSGFCKKLSDYWLHMLAVFIATFPGTVLIYYDNVLIRNITFSPSELPWVLSTVLVIGSAIVSIVFIFDPVLSHLQNRRDNNQNSNRPDDNSQPGSNISKKPLAGDFFSRLPGELDTSLVSMSMHDHYIEVLTLKGRHMLYMKFSEAMDELKNYDGVRTHRSHWVATAAVRKIRKDGRSIKVIMKDGRELPVSKTNRNAVELILRDIPVTAGQDHQSRVRKTKP